MGECCDCPGLMEHMTLFKGTDGEHRCMHHNKYHLGLTDGNFRRRKVPGVKVEKELVLDEWMFILCERMLRKTTQQNLSDIFGISAKDLRLAMRGEKITHEIYNKINVGIRRNISDNIGVIPLLPSQSQVSSSSDSDVE